MTEKPAYIAQCDVCSHPARAEIDFVLAEKKAEVELGGAGSKFKDITLQVEKLIQEKYPDAKRVSEASLRLHYRKHQLAPGLADADIDYEQGLVRIGGRVLRVRKWLDTINILRMLAFYNIIQHPQVLSPKDFINLTQLARDIQGPQEEDELTQYLAEKIGLPPPKEAAGALLPPDAKLNNKSEKPSGD